MNLIFDDCLELINSFKINSGENEIKDIENQINDKIKDILSKDDDNKSTNKYIKYVEEYDSTIIKYKKKTNPDINNDKQQQIRDILYEQNSFYNSKDKHIEFPYISYLTDTNFCTYDDFKKQYLYFENDSKSYPIIDCVLKENKILKIIEFIPKLNELVNLVYNELLMNIREEEANEKIRDKIPNLNFNDFNSSLKKFLETYDKEDLSMELNMDTKIWEVINIKKEGNKIFKIYNWIIHEYNKFYESLNIYKKNKDYIKEVIIQNCSENDYISFKYNNKSIKDRLKEILYLYSKRNRINNNRTINVYDGGKILYDFELIENLLEKEFALCKRKFSKTQKLFIFSDNIFSQECKIFKDLNRKFPQEEIINNIDELITVNDKDNDNNNDKDNDNNNDKDNDNENNIRKIYYNCLYLISYLTRYLKDEHLLNAKETSLDYVIKLMEKEGFKIHEEFKQEKYGNIKISQILHLYEIIEEKAFDSLIKKIENEIKLFGEIHITEEDEEKIKNILDSNVVLKQEEIIKGIKKYIVRYYLGNKNGDEFTLNDIKLDDILNKSSVWDKQIFNNEKFKNESNELISFNQKDNNVLRYFYRIIFENILKGEEPEPEPGPLYEDEKKEEENLLS